MVYYRIPKILVFLAQLNEIECFICLGEKSTRSINIYASFIREPMLTLYFDEWDGREKYVHDLTYSYLTIWSLFEF